MTWHIYPFSHNNGIAKGYDVCNVTERLLFAESVYAWVRRNFGDALKFCITSSNEALSPSSKEMPLVG